MELPNLINKLKSKPEKPQMFLAIEITSQVVKTACWQIEGVRSKILAIGSVQAWEVDESHESLLMAIDQSLSESLAGINSNPDQVIFNLPDPWIEKDTIIPEYKQVLKKICESFALKPVGFVVITEAVVHYLHEQEGGPSSCILVKIEVDELFVSIVRLGNIDGNQIVGRSNDICQDIEEGIARFPKNESIPSRIILFDGHDDLEDIRQSIIDYDWQGKLPFLHFPKIEILPKDATIKAAVLAGTSEIMGSIDASKNNTSVPHSGSDIQQAGFNDLTQIVEEEEPELPDLSQTFGFKDVTLDEPTKLSPIRSNENELETVSAEIKKPVLLVKKRGEISEISDENIYETEKSNINEVSRSKLAKIGSEVRKILGMINPIGLLRRLVIPKPVLPSKTGRVLIVGLVLLGISSTIFAYWYFPSTTTTIYLALEPQTKQLTFILDPTITDIDPEGLRVATKKELITESVSEESAATGTITVGERAKGVITIFNRTTVVKRFDAGTVVSAGDKAFTLDTEVSIASASTKENPDFSLTIEPSSRDVAVTATAIGSQFNMAKDTQLSVANFGTDTYVARATSSFAGGSSRDVTVVTSTDIERLTEKVKEQLRSKLTQAVELKKTQDLGVYVDIDPEYSEISLNREEGQEANSILAEMSATQTIYLYDLTSITVLAQQRLANEVPTDMRPRSDLTTVEPLETSLDDGQITIDAKVTLQLYTEINQQDVINSIRAKTPIMVEEYFKTLPNFMEYTTEFRPDMPDMIKRYPFRHEQINVRMVTRQNN